MTFVGRHVGRSERARPGVWESARDGSPEELAAFGARLRVYAISDQDNSGTWIRKEFPQLFYIVTPGVNAVGGFHHATWIGSGGDRLILILIPSSEVTPIVDPSGYRVETFGTSSSPYDVGEIQL